MKSRYALAALLLGLTCSCGGGGGGDGEAPFAGVWNGTLTLVEDGCGAVDPYSFVYFTHLVNQNGAVVIVDNGVMTFSGRIEGEHGFQTSAARPYPLFDSRQDCTETITWRYQDINTDADAANFVVRLSEIRCGGTEQPVLCRFGFSGSGYRGSRVPDWVYATDQPVGEASVNEADL